MNEMNDFKNTTLEVTPYLTHRGSSDETTPFTHNNTKNLSKMQS